MSQTVVVTLVDLVSGAPEPPPRVRNHQLNKHHCQHPHHRHGKSPLPPPLPSQPPSASSSSHSQLLHGVKSGYPSCLSNYTGPSSFTFADFMPFVNPLYAVCQSPFPSMAECISNSLVRFWCLFVSKRMANNAVMSQS